MSKPQTASATTILKYLGIQWPVFILAILCVFEYSFTFRNICHFGKFWHPTIMLLVGFAIFFISYYRSRQTLERSPVQHASYITWLVFVSVFTILFTLSYNGILRVLEIREVSTAFSDIIPATQLYVSRFLNGQFPYEIMDFGWKVFPNYLPMRWLPYVPAQLLDIDFRLWTWLLYLLSTSVVVSIMIKRGYGFMHMVAAILAFGVFNHRYLKDGAQDLSMTIEFMNVAVYLLLAVAILSKRWWVIALAILICSLSRFSFAFWVPFYLLYLWYDRGFVFPFKIGLLVLLGVIVVYIIPFESQNWGVFFEGMQYYKHAIVREWMPQNWQQLTDIPVHLDRCTGFAYHMLESGNGSIEDKVVSYGRIHLLASFGIMVIVSLLFWFSKNKINNKSYFILASLKIYLLVFYAFIAVPYIYLNVVSFIITICLLVFPAARITTRQVEIDLS